ncbi:MAG TPA: hypothetical protein VM120_16980 [Bryobacteraceae bacterium]|nr:hypothetical protein [Bryobacteraceae bacterium]
MQNPQRRRTLINEVITSAILRKLQIRVPASALIHVSAEFLRDNAEVRIRLSNGSHRAVLPGLHFGSRLSVDPATKILYDLLPRPVARRITNQSDFIRTLAVDKWTGNTDRRQAVFYYNPRLVAEMIDHGLTLGGDSWKFYDAPLAGVHSELAVYDEVRSWDDFEPHISLIEAFTRSDLEEALAQVPLEWYCP